MFPGESYLSSWRKSLLWGEEGDVDTELILTLHLITSTLYLCVRLGGLLFLWGTPWTCDQQRSGPVTAARTRDGNTKLLAPLPFQFVGGMGVCWALSQTKCIWQISWKYTMSATTDEGFWHSSSSMAVLHTQISPALWEESAFCFFCRAPPGWNTGGVWELRLVRERWQLAAWVWHLCWGLAKEPLSCFLRLFYLFCHTCLLFPLCFHYPFFSPLCVTHENALAYLLTPSSDKSLLSSITYVWVFSNFFCFAGLPPYILVFFSKPHSRLM